MVVVAVIGGSDGVDSGYGAEDGDSDGSNNCNGMMVLPIVGYGGWVIEVTVVVAVVGVMMADVVAMVAVVVMVMVVVAMVTIMTIVTTTMVDVW